MAKELEKERQMVERAKKDPKCFADLYELYLEPIYRYVYRRVNDVEVAEDLVGQTFCDALAHIGSFEFQGYPFSAWLYKIAHNNVLKWYRVNGRMQKVSLEDGLELKAEDDVKKAVEKANDKEAVLEFLNQLDYEERELIRLKYFEEVSNMEIAVIMGVTANNVGVKLYRALRKLKQLMAK